MTATIAIGKKIASITDTTLNTNFNTMIAKITRRTPVKITLKSFFLIFNSTFINIFFIPNVCKTNTNNYLICFAIFLINYTVFISICLIIIDYFNKFIKISNSTL